MSAARSDTVARPTGAGPRPRIWNGFAHAPSRRRPGRQPYSPALCISLLLMVGLVIKIGPAVHAYLAQN
jgi:hypothetical protein